MATDEQKAASKKVMDAVTALNDALREASSVEIYVELVTSNEFGLANPIYLVSKIETREMVMP